MSAPIRVAAAQSTGATGGGAIPGDGAAGAGTFTSLIGPTYSENNTAEIGTGTIILKVPGGFIFDTGGTPPTVLIDKVSGGSPLDNAQGSMTSVTSTQLVLTVTRTSQSGQNSILTWHDVRVRPT